MQTRTYGDLFKLVQSLAGVTAFATNEQDDIANLINRRYQVAYNTSQMWPRYLVPSEKRDISAYVLSGADSTSTINQNYRLLGQQNDSDSKNIYEGLTTPTTRIYHNGTNWVVATGTTFTRQTNGKYTRVVAGSVVFTEADSPSKDHIEDVETWSTSSAAILSVVAQSLIPYAQTNKNTIGEFLRIHRKQAFLNHSSIEYDFFVDFNGANLLNIANTTDNEAFVTYKKNLTLFTTSSDYTNSTEEVPAEFFQYIAYGAYADFLRMDGQHDKAQLESENAELSLAQQLERVDAIMNNNTINKKFSTYVNRQSR